MIGVMDSLLRIFFVCVLFTATRARFIEDVCLPIEQTKEGPIPPPLPTNYELKGELIDKSGKDLTYEEIYFDFDNLRAKHMLLNRGVERHLLFDYSVSQVIEYYILHPGSTLKDDPLSYVCSTEAIDRSQYRDIFGYREEVKNTPMYDSHHALRYGGPYQYAFNGSSGDPNDDDGRGLIWNAFISCVNEIDADRSALVRYKFSGANMVTSGGNSKGDVDGSGRNDGLSVPVAADYKGSQMVLNKTSGEKMVQKFNVSQYFQWFKANPEFDEKNFQIPPWMYCNGYRKSEKFLKFPMAFSVRHEMTTFSQDMLGKRTAGELVAVSELYYYNEIGLARRDFTPHKEADSDIIAKFGNAGPVKMVYDYVTLQVYVINKPTGRCYSRPVRGHDEYFSIHRETTLAEMATPEELFLFPQENIEYKGQYFARDINCDVWIGKSFDKDVNATFYSEIYMSTNGWHFDADDMLEFGIPVKNSIIVNTETGEFLRTVTENNFFKLKAYPPMLFNFDITECVETIEHSYFAIRLLVPVVEMQETLMTYRYVFLESAQYYLATVSDLTSPLRIQRISLSVSKSGVFLTFAIVEKPKGTVLNPSKGVDVEDAVINLREVVDEGNFMILFAHPETKEDIPITAEPGNFFDWYPGGNLTAKPTKIAEKTSRKHGKGGSHVIYQHLVNEDKPAFRAENSTKNPQKQEQPKKGMSSGALGGLAVGMLLIGIAIGIAVMYLYVRKYSGDHEEIGYAMHTTG